MGYTVGKGDPEKIKNKKPGLANQGGAGDNKKQLVNNR